MAVPESELREVLEKNFPEAEIKIVDLAGDDDHYSVTICDKSFVGKSRVAQHKIVNEALKDLLKERLHAMQLKTIIPK